MAELGGEMGSGPAGPEAELAGADGRLAGGRECFDAEAGPANGEAAQGCGDAEAVGGGDPVQPAARELAAVLHGQGRPAEVGGAEGRLSQPASGLLAETGAVLAG